MLNRVEKQKSKQQGKQGKKVKKGYVLVTLLKACSNKQQVKEFKTTAPGNANDAPLFDFCKRRKYEVHYLSANCCSISNKTFCVWCFQRR